MQLCMEMVVLVEVEQQFLAFNLFLWEKTVSLFGISLFSLF